MNIQAAVSSPSSAPAGGVCTHSTDAAYQDYIVFCVGNDKVREAAFRAWAIDQGIGFKSLVGSYQGIVEASFIVNAKHLEAIRPWTVKEESILMLNAYRLREGSRRATLMFGDGREEVELGFFHAVSKEFALTQEAWTFDPSTGTYWVAG